MDTSTNDMSSVPTIHQFYVSLTDMFQSVPEQLKDEFMTVKLIDSVVNNKNDLSAVSPRAKRLKAVVEFSHNHLPLETRNSFINCERLPSTKNG
jgi:hypothetical protein